MKLLAVLLLLVAGCAGWHPTHTQVCAGLPMMMEVCSDWEPDGESK